MEPLNYKAFQCGSDYHVATVGWANGDRDVVVAPTLKFFES